MGVAQTGPRSLLAGTDAGSSAGYRRPAGSVASQLPLDAIAVSSAPLILFVAHSDSVVGDMAAELHRAEYRTKIVAPENVAILQALSLCPDLVVLSLDALGTAGMATLHRLHRLLPLLPVVLMSADADEPNLVEGLAAGADDFLSCSISPVQLVARVRAVLRRSVRLHRHQPVLEAGPLVIDARARRAEVFGVDTRLTQTEFNLLVFMMRHPRQVLRRAVLLEQVWGYTFGDASTVTVHVRRLRTKVEPDPANPIAIRTVWGVGYLFDPAGPPAWSHFDPDVPRRKSSSG